MRLELNTPVVKGRIVMPSIEVRLKVLKAWSQSEKESDIFVRYQQLIDQFPGYSLAQLHSIINDEKFFEHEHVYGFLLPTNMRLVLYRSKHVNQ